MLFVTVSCIYKTSHGDPLPDEKAKKHLCPPPLLKVTFALFVLIVIALVPASGAWYTEALSIHDRKPPDLSRRSCEPHAGRRLFARNAGWHIRQEYIVRASPDADDRIAAKTDGEGASRHLDFYRLRPCLFLKFDAGYGRSSCLGPHPDLEALHGRIRLTKHPVARQTERRSWGHGRVSR